MGKKPKMFDRKPKVNLIFDENKRREFLCGFRKRKLERKKKAHEELQLKLKEEKRRIKQENKEMYKKLVVSSRPIPDIEQLLKEEYEDDNVNVKIVEISTETLHKRDYVIGPNKVNENTVIESVSTEKSSDTGDNILPGMSVDVQDAKEPDSDEGKIKTKKEIKKMLKKTATKKVKKSKAFQMKNKMERSNNRKQSRLKRNNSEKNKNKFSKNKHKNRSKKAKK